MLQDGDNNGKKIINWGSYYALPMEQSHLNNIIVLNNNNAGNNYVLVDDAVLEIQSPGSPTVEPPYDALYEIVFYVDTATKIVLSVPNDVTVNSNLTGTGDAANGGNLSTDGIPGTFYKLTRTDCNTWQFTQLNNKNFTQMNVYTDSDFTNGSRTITVSDLQNGILCNCSNACTLLLPAHDDLGIRGTNPQLNIIQWGAGSVSVDGTNGANVRSTRGLYQAYGQYAEFYARATLPDNWILGGDLQ